MSKTLGAWLTITDADGKPLASSVQLGGQTPVPPLGSLEYAKANGENRISWEPSAGVRSAIVIMPYSGEKPGYVIAGRSLVEVENREALALHEVLLGGAITLIASFLAKIISHLKPKNGQAV
jgi:hypothetical protein